MRIASFHFFGTALKTLLMDCLNHDHNRTSFWSYSGTSFRTLWVLNTGVIVLFKMLYSQSIHAFLCTDVYWTVHCIGLSFCMLASWHLACLLGACLHGTCLHLASSHGIRLHLALAACMSASMDSASVYCPPLPFMPGGHPMGWPQFRLSALCAPLL